MIRTEQFYRTQSKLTEFNENLYRSRLEARWAVFFVTADIDYIYELEGFTLKNGKNYLPDFYLPELDIYAEVKPRVRSEFNKVINDLDVLSKSGESTANYPVKPSTTLEKELYKIRLLSEGSKKPVILLDSHPTNKPYLIFNKGWQLGFWSDNKDKVITIQYKELKDGYNNTHTRLKKEYLHLNNYFKIAQESQFEHGKIPTIESIALIKKELFSFEKVRVKIENKKQETILELIKSGKYIDAKYYISRKFPKVCFENYTTNDDFYSSVLCNIDLTEFFSSFEINQFLNILKNKFNLSCSSSFETIKGVQYLVVETNNSDVSYNLFDILSIYLEKQDTEILNIVKVLFNANITLYPQYRVNNNLINCLEEAFLSENFSVDYPNINRFVSNYTEHIISILKILNTYVEIDISGKPQVINYMSELHIAETLNELHPDKPISKTLCSRLIRLLSLFNIINKLDDKELRRFPDLKDMLLTNKLKGSRGYRSDVYTLSFNNINKKYTSLTFEEIETNFKVPEKMIPNIDKYAGLLISKGINLSIMSYERLYLNLGPKTAYKVYPQNKDSKQIVSELTTSISEYIVEKTYASISTYGFVKQDALLVAICRKYHIKKVVAKARFLTIENNFLASSDLVAVRLNKQYKEKFNVPQTEKSMKIYIPSDEVI